MVKIDIDTEKCIGCGACINSCPQKLYKLNDGKAKLTGDIEKCTLCRICEKGCPTGSITITE